MGDHTESLLIEYDPSYLSYEDLLNMFWSAHNPRKKSLFRDRQYMSLLIYNNQQQHETALRSKEMWEKELGGPIKTEFQEASTFYQAEDYHQKYFLKRFPRAVKALESVYPTARQLTDSTVAARMNGMVRGSGKTAELKKELLTWNISEQEKTQLLQALDQVRW